MPDGRHNGGMKKKIFQKMLILPFEVLYHATSPKHIIYYTIFPFLAHCAPTTSNASGSNNERSVKFLVGIVMVFFVCHGFRLFIQVRNQ